MMKLEVHIELQSDTTFGRGDGMAGLVDEDITYDVTTGLPFIRGRVIKGLLVEECANILFALEGQPQVAVLAAAAEFLFGQTGLTGTAVPQMYVGAAQLPLEVQQAVRYELSLGKDSGVSIYEVLASMTAIRRQTAVDASHETPKEGSLRAMRVLNRGIQLTATLDFPDLAEVTALSASQRSLLAACVAAWRRGGTGRNRGRGRLCAYLESEAEQAAYLAEFQQLLGVSA